MSDDPGTTAAGDPTSFTVTTPPLLFYTLTPCRVLDTRRTSPQTSGVARTLDIAGLCGIPPGVRAVAANLTDISPTTGGFLTVYPSGGAVPLASSLNFARGQIRTNNVVLPLGGGRVDAKAGLPGGGQVHLVIDVVGYFR